MTIDGPRVAEKGKVDHIPGVVLVTRRKYFKGIGEKKKEWEWILKSMVDSARGSGRFRRFEKHGSGFGVLGGVNEALNCNLSVAVPSLPCLRTSSKSTGKHGAFVYFLETRFNLRAP